MLSKIKPLYLRFSGLTLSLESFALLGLRLMVAREFWRSGLAKVETVELFGLRLPTPEIQQNTYMLFAYEYFDGSPEWFTDTAAVLGTIGELTLPLLLAFGLFARVGAAGLLVMAAVIQFFVYPDLWWSAHAWWFASLAVLLTAGPGRLSLDGMLGLLPPRR